MLSFYEVRTAEASKQLEILGYLTESQLAPVVFVRAKVTMYLLTKCANFAIWLDCKKTDDTLGNSRRWKYEMIIVCTCE